MSQQHTIPDQTLVAASGRLVPGADPGNLVMIAPHLALVPSAAGDILVRRWERGATQARVETIARTLDAAIAAGASALRTWDVVPEVGGRSVIVNGHVCARGRWIDGRPLARYGGYRDPDGATVDVPLPPSVAAAGILAEATRQIALLHQASRDIPIAAAGTMTIRALLETTRTGYARQRRIIGDHAAAFPEIRRWLRCANRVLPVASERALESSGSIDDASVMVHGDLWPTHLLVSDGAAGQRLAGIVGWSNGRRGSPLIDLAHLASHMSPWSAANAETLIGAYTAVAPLRPEERRLLPVIAALDLVGRVAHLLQAAFVDDRMIGDESQGVLRSGLKTLLVSLETLTNVLAPEVEWTKRQTQYQRAVARGLARRQGTGPPRGGADRPRRGPGSGRRKTR